MSDKELENFDSISFQIVLKGSASLRPVTVYLDSGDRRKGSGPNHQSRSGTESYDSKTDPEGQESRPKYACPHCGSVELRSDLNTFDVFIAREEALVHVRDEGTPGGLQELYCYECGEEIETEGLGNIRIE